MPRPSAIVRVVALVLALFALPAGGVAHAAPTRILSAADRASFARLASSLSGTEGLAVSGVGRGQAVERVGGLRSAIAWSTSKVPVAMAVLAAGQGGAHSTDLTQAITASDWLAFPLMARSYGLKSVGDELTTEAYAPVIESGASAWVDFVEGVLAEADAEGDWERSYAKWFGPLGGSETGYPDMTIEEAAALFPKDV